MAPEQIDCLPVDSRTDIFALGLTTYEMLTGRRPFAEEDAWEVMDLRLKQDIPDPKEAVPDLPEPLRKFVLKACARDASQRYQDVSEIIDELKSLTDKLGLRKQEISRERRKIATMFLMYKEEHQPELNRMMQDFCEKVNDLGVSCKAADFKEI
jgi:serine/threonine protein kinase